MSFQPMSIPSQTPFSYSPQNPAYSIFKTHARSHCLTSPDVTATSCQLLCCPSSPERLFLSLAAPDLSCGLQDLRCSTWASWLRHAGYSSLTRDGTWTPALGARSLTHWTTGKSGDPFNSGSLHLLGTCCGLLFIQSEIPTLNWNPHLPLPSSHLLQLCSVLVGAPSCPLLGCSSSIHWPCFLTL